MRILYAAGNRYSAFWQLKRFLETISNKKYDVCIAAYSKSFGYLNIDYNLDALLNFSNQSEKITFNQNFKYYMNEIKIFSPDLIISDLEVYSSLIGFELKKPVWQVSPLLIYFALSRTDKYAINMHKLYAHSIHTLLKKSSFINKIIINSNKKCVVSHLCDTINRPILNDDFEWIRPEFIMFDRTDQTRMFSGAARLKISDDISYGLFNEPEYRMNGGNGRYFISDGSPTFLSDAFYNQKFCFSYVDHNDIASLISAHINKYYGLGDIISDDTLFDDLPIGIEIDDNIKFLSEHLN